MIDNERIRRAIWEFHQKNPWAQDFDPNMSMRADNIRLSADLDESLKRRVWLEKIRLSKYFCYSFINQNWNVSFHI